ncbi:hypothetical protein DQ244_01625 [Blastococcus sp. TBT05-19]|uniref:hypothetical protein n=1 Tax=Blastococcus sp. TBT05-19 TaxID=2250581 RepID=UPI000DEBBD7F|nr:hypothetical protein [Blastococcus sp. TBT05-19]RBY94087.1 hypothetical protein DQ244_01625 [Blastococcus sp. TBT05-19]
MSHVLDRLKVQESRAALPGLAKRMQTLQMELTREITAARAFTDPDLSPEGLGKRREQLAETARKRADQELTALTAEMRQHIGRVREWAESRRPRVVDDPVQLQKMSLAWDRARAMLDNGRSIRQVLAESSDPAMVLAVREWGPDYLRANEPRDSGLAGYAQRPEPVDYSGLIRSADERLGELLRGEVATAVAALRELDVMEAGWQSRSANVGQQIVGGAHDPLQAAIEAHYAEQMAGAGYQDSGDDTGDSPPTGDAA